MTVRALPIRGAYASGSHTHKTEHPHNEQSIAWTAPVPVPVPRCCASMPTSLCALRQVVAANACTCTSRIALVRLGRQATAEDGRAGLDEGVDLLSARVRGRESGHERLRRDALLEGPAGLALPAGRASDRCGAHAPLGGGRRAHGANGRGRHALAVEVVLPCAHGAVRAAGRARPRAAATLIVGLVGAAWRGRRRWRGRG